MGEKHCVICKACQTISWLENYEIPNYINEHRGHVIYIVPDDVIGDTTMFETFIAQLLDW